MLFESTFVSFLKLLTSNVKEGRVLRNELPSIPLVVAGVQVGKVVLCIEVLADEFARRGVGAVIDSLASVRIVIKGLGEGAGGVGDGVRGAQVVRMRIGGACGGAVPFDGGEQGVSCPDVFGGGGRGEFVVLGGVCCCCRAVPFRHSLGGVVVEVEGGGAGGGVYGRQAGLVVPGVGLGARRGQVAALVIGIGCRCGTRGDLRDSMGVGIAGTEIAVAPILRTLG